MAGQDAQDLAEFVRARSPEAFARLAGRYAGMVYRVCLRHLGNHEDAEDAAQAVFLALARHAGSVRADSLGAWLHRTALRAAAFAARSRSARQRHEKEAAAMIAAKDAPAEVPAASHGEALACMDVLLDELPGRLREAVARHYLAGVPRAALARELGVPEGTVQSRLNAGLRQLRERLARRGVALSGAALAGLLASQAQAGVPAALLASLPALASGTLAAGAGTGAGAQAIAEGVLKMMFWTKVKVAAAVVGAVLVVGGGAVAVTLAAAEPAGEKAAGDTPAAPGAVLSLDSGSFRAFLRWKTPVLVDKDGRLVPLPEPKRKDQKEEDRKPYPVAAAALPPPNWAAPDFDDSAWPRARGGLYAPETGILWGMSVPPGGPNYHPGNPAEWQMICLRGMFRVSDPRQVRDLTFNMRYHGGVVVYVNGQEVQRGHLPAGKLDPETLAEPYPDEAYVRPDGKIYLPISDAKPFAERFKCRVRELPPKGASEEVLIPASLLKKGLNVIAVDVRSAPVSKLVITAEHANPRYTLESEQTTFGHAAVLDARLTSASGAGLASGVIPSGELCLTNVPPMESVEVWDGALPAEAIRPVRLVGARRGSFSGKVVLSSAAAIRRPRAAASDLVQKGGGGKLPASAVQIRWAEPAAAAVSFNYSQRFDRLLAEPPAEVAPATILTLRDRVGAGSTHRSNPPPVAVLPVWITVQVPADAPAGTYQGTVTLEAEGAAPAKFAVPVELKVSGWTLPEPKDFACHHNFYQSPDTLAWYYQVPFWSDQHWELIGKSLAALQQLGNKICVLNLARMVPTLNNNESMVRWVKKPGGGYDYDFTIAEKHMDVYEKTCGKPGILQLNIWGYAGNSSDVTATAGRYPPLAVTVFDPDTKKLETLPQPAYGTPENEAFWKPVLVELRKRIEKRGWFDVTAVCYTSYSYQPTKTMVDVFRNIWPDGRWMNSSHSNLASYPGTQGSMPVPYNEGVWAVGILYDPDAKPGLAPSIGLEACPRDPGQFPRPWKHGPKRLEFGNARQGIGFVYELSDHSPLAMYRAVTELALQGNDRGLGRAGGDSWPVPRGRVGTEGVYGSKPHNLRAGGTQKGEQKYDSIFDAAWGLGPANNVTSITSAGPGGAAFNERSEMFREGVQTGEAIIFLQRALEAKSVSGDIARRIEDLLNERARYNIRTRVVREVNWLAFESSAWQERDDRLFSLAAEVARAAK